jgi:hypothetical protein
MPTNGVQTQPPAVVRRLDSETSAGLVALAEVFEDLQTVLRCCEHLVEELGRDQPDRVTVEAVWTMGLLSYARCFAPGPAALTDEDLAAAQPTGDVLEWHRVLVQLRDHYADPAANPRERFSVGVSQGAEGAPSGVAITSAVQPLVDELTVRQTGAIAYELSGLVNARIEEQQAQVFEELRGLSAADLEKLDRIEVVEPNASP